MCIVKYVIFLIGLFSCMIALSYRRLFIDFTKKHFVYIIIAIALSAGFSAIYLFLRNFGFTYFDSVEKWGQTGDFFGGILNPTFTFLGFSFLIYTINQNRNNLKISNDQLGVSNQQLKLSSESLEATIIEMKESKAALEEQSAALQQQNFQNTFFNLIKLYHDAVNIMETSWNGQSVKGKVCFLAYHEQLRGVYNTSRQDKYDDELNRIDFVYPQYLIEDKNRRQIMTAIMNIYTILRFIDDLPVKDKRFFVRTLASQFSSHELVLFFYHSLHSEGNKRFKDFIEKYGLLQNIDKSLLFNGDIQMKLYADSAYI